MTQFYTLEKVSSADNLVYSSLSERAPSIKYLACTAGQRVLVAWVPGILSAE